MVALRVARPPELVQVAGHRPGRAHDDVARTGDRVHRTDDLALRGQRSVAERVQPVDLAIPLVVQACRLRPIRVGDARARRRERLDREPRIRDDRDGGVLPGVGLGDVHVDEAHLGPRERGL